MYKNEIREMTEAELLEFMNENGWTSEDDYIEDYRFEVYEFFKLESAVAITELFYKTRKVVA